MKKNLTLIAMIFLIYNLSYSQNQKYFTHLFSGEIHYYNNVEYISNTFSKSYFLVNGNEIQKETVKFYKNNNGFFANTKDLSFSSSSNFVKREISGNINLFSKEYTTFTTVNNSNGLMMGSLGPNTTISYYYNKGEFGDLKKSNYKNLKVDLSDNLKSMSYLNKFKSVKQRETLLYILGGAIMTVGVSSLINKTSNVPQGETAKTGGSFAIIGLGFGTIITNYLTTKNKHDHIETAIGIYNF